ncbi:MAG: hypothetical protein HFF36_12295 [Coprobacillus sp.]|nr:hypothetical protein [Coprobacillus sp.]
MNDKSIVNVKADGSLDISVENKLFQKIRGAHTWYTSQNMSWVAIILFAVIDIFGFGQITRLTMKESALNQAVIIASLAVAFELAPLYIGYALCLKSHGLGKPIHNWVLRFSLAACALGILGNIFFRFFTRDIAYNNAVTGETNLIALPLTVLMSILPIITSLVNVTIGCLSFDPLLFDLMRLSKKLQKLQVRERQITAYLEEYKNEDKVKEDIQKDEQICYERVREELDMIRTKLNLYVVTITTFE